MQVHQLQDMISGNYTPELGLKKANCIKLELIELPCNPASVNSLDLGGKEILMLFKFQGSLFYLFIQSSLLFCLYSCLLLI